MLALEIYNIVNKINIKVAILVTLHQITNQLKLLPILLIVYIDLYFFYKCLIKLESTKKKVL